MTNQANQPFFGFLVAFATATVGYSALAYEVAPADDAGTIEGSVLYNGKVPIKKIIPTKDVETCGGVREEAVIQVNGDGAVQDAVVYLVDVEKGKAWPEQGEPPKLNNVDCRFEPKVQVIRKGTIDVVNKDPVLHNTHGYYGRRTAFNLALPNQDQTIPTNLKRTGTVRVDCDAHGWMEGWIYVVDNPYYAITGADGKFAITDVPPGDYTLVAVQPFTGPQKIPVTVKPGEASQLEVELKK